MQIRFHRVNLSERDRRSSLQSQTEARFTIDGVKKIDISVM
jgi:hypothetical protein